MVPVVVILSFALSTVVNISNVQPRRDNTGKIMDCHDGNIAYENGTYWFYCMAYGLCNNLHDCATAACGGRLDHNVSLYSSPDLTSGSWNYEADLLPVSTRVQGTYYRPKVVYNSATGKHVLWINVLPRPGTPAPPPDFTKSSYLVATSSTGPKGPYTIVVKNVTMKHGEGGDFDVFVDDDGKAYVIYTSLASHHSISIAPLTSDYTESIPGANTDFLPGSTGGCYEAPGMFKRNDVYYATFGPCSCFGVGGSETYIYTAKTPLGPYTRVGSLGNAEKAQQNYVFQAPLADGTMAYVWTGDRWKSTPDGEKGHDFQFWQPLQFKATNSTNNGKFIKTTDGDAVYYFDGIKTVNHVPFCEMCEHNICSDLQIVPDSFLQNKTIGPAYNCSMDPSPIAPLMSPSTLPSFTLDLK
eukprot:m.68002 g.68002  ORF g.68002 m.68002 type:complete len:412 (+) comp11929_c0_seq2:48-1283(+)